jgi:hypothetical protein
MKTSQIAFAVAALITVSSCNDASDSSAPPSVQAQVEALPNEQPEPDRGPPAAARDLNDDGKNDFFVEVQGSKLASARAALLNLAFHQPGQAEAELAFQVEEGDAQLSLVLIVPYENLASRKFSARVVVGPPTRGQATATLFLGDEQQREGLVSISMAPGGRFSGSVEGHGIEFFGKLVLSCAVPAQSLPSKVAVPIPDDGTPVLVNDSEFKSAECSKAKLALL